MAKVLLVDDDVIFCQYVKKRLEVAGHQVQTATNGRVALAEASSCHPDLILMDMHMPVMDGHEATRQLIASGFREPIIALIASVMPPHLQAALGVGCQAVISKPIGEDFEDSIAKYLKPQEFGALSMEVAQ